MALIDSMRASFVFLLLLVGCPDKPHVHRHDHAVSAEPASSTPPPPPTPARASSAAVERPAPPAGNANVAAWHPAEVRLAIVEDKTLTVIDPRQPATRTIATTAGDDNVGPIKHVGWSSASDRIAAGSDEAINIFDSKTGKRIRTIEAPGHETLTLSHDGRWVATSDGTARVWNVDSGAALQLAGENEWNWSVSFFADNAHVGAANAMGLYVWQLRSGRRALLKDFDTGATSPVEVSHDGRFFAVSLGQHGLNVFRLSDRSTTSLMGVQSCDDHMKGLLFARDHKTFVMRTASGWWRSWSLPSLEEKSRFTPTPADAPSWLSDDGLTAAVWSERGIEIWDVAKNVRRLSLDSALDASWRHTVGLAFSGDGRYLAFDSGPVAVWNVEDGKALPL